MEKSTAHHPPPPSVPVRPPFDLADHSVLYRGSRPDSLTAAPSDKEGMHGCVCSEVTKIIDPAFEYVGAVPTAVVRLLLTVLLSRSGVEA
jgi:hypothetical protein